MFLGKTVDMLACNHQKSSVMVPIAPLKSTLQSPDLCKIKNDCVSHVILACDVSGTDVAAAAAFDLISITKACLQKKNDKVKKTKS